VLVLIMMTIGTMVAVSGNTPKQITVEEAEPLVGP
jgi:hypothetical protein